MKSPSDSTLTDSIIHLISDLHLDAGRPETTRLLIDYLNGPARRARSLYILGDLFEVWIGDDAPDPVAETLLSHFRALADAGTSLYFMVGNRDFMLGDDYCQKAGMQRIEEPVVLEDIQPRTLLMHGDVLCTDDHEYQRFRSKVRDPAWQTRMLSRPIWLRRAIASLARAISRRRNRHKSESIMDVNPDAVQACFRTHPVKRLIHGHTHRPAVHNIEVDGKHHTRLVLGDWHGERGSLIQVEGNQAELLVIERDPGGEVRLRNLP